LIAKFYSGKEKAIKHREKRTMAGWHDVADER
jgi:hypothetical protein